MSTATATTLSSSGNNSRRSMLSVDRLTRRFGGRHALGAPGEQPLVVLVKGEGTDEDQKAGHEIDVVPCFDGPRHLDQQPQWALKDDERAREQRNDERRVVLIE